jgi:S-adenosylmethionine:tRNA ribosyltransferase-isomerase
MHPKDISIKDYSYTLPDEKIARYPLEARDTSKLLIYRNGKISESVFQNIADIIPEASLLIANNTKVINARLKFKTTTGASVEIFCLEPLPDFRSNNNIQNPVKWKCLVGNAAKWKEKHLHLGFQDAVLNVEIMERLPDCFVVEFSWNNTQSFMEVLEKTGSIPIPPYLKRNSEVTDLQRYQTTYAKHDGSVAAPTAGLHFTEKVFDSLKQIQVTINEVTLHVGAGTFKPVKSEKLQEHTMHSEWIEVSKDTIEKIIQAGNKTVIAVGTTSLRTIETIYWMGIKVLQNPNIKFEDLEVKQWDAYELTANFQREEALQALLNWMQANNANHIFCTTSILIAPPYKLRVADALITNFHQPNSTLLLLVAAVVGNDWRSIYDYALSNHFRFLSYGDSSILFRRN